MDKILTLSAEVDRLVSLVVRHASVCDWPSVKIYEERLRRCRSILAQSQTPGF